ncbi:PadR family transcriptional regulator [Spirillospora sp. CA-294931]|uniref:PadR family transcriptional regulator n=1 Tax=Spirillospora sp. CA-294931 TaxID=3240042 RepID=UPI003D90E887
MSESPLSLVVLALLFEGPAHPYRMHKLISERGKDEVVNVRSRNSVQQTVQRLERDGLIEAAGTEREGAYPPRTVYAITETGRRALLDSLYRLLATPAREYPAFSAALSFMAIASAETAARLLRERRGALARDVDRRSGPTERAARTLPAILLIEDDYSLAMRRAEIAWLDRTIAAIDAGDLAWDPQRLIDEAPGYER